MLTGKIVTIVSDEFGLLTPWRWRSKVLQNISSYRWMWLHIQAPQWKPQISTDLIFCVSHIQNFCPMLHTWLLTRCSPRKLIKTSLLILLSKQQLRLHIRSLASVLSNKQITHNLTFTIGSSHTGNTSIMHTKNFTLHFAFQRLFSVTYLRVHCGKFLV